MLESSETPILKGMREFDNIKAHAESDQHCMYHSSAEIRKSAFVIAAWRKRSPSAVHICNECGLLTGIACLCILFTVTDAGFTESPQNVAVFEGARVTLPCSTNQTSYNLEWSAVDQGSIIYSIFDGHEVNPRYSQYYDIDKSVPGHFPMVVKQAAKERAIRYICADTVNDQPQSAELTVIESKPGCSKKSTNAASITIMCQVNFSGNWPPVLMWMSNNKKYSKGAQLDTIPNTRVTLTLTVPRDVIANHQQFTCIAGFTADAYRGDATAKNVPDFHEECKLIVELSGSCDQNPNLEEERFTRKDSCHGSHTMIPLSGNNEVPELRSSSFMVLVVILVRLLL